MESEHICFSADCIAKASKLEEEVGNSVMLDELQVFEWFKRMGYEGKGFTTRREIKKSYLSKKWRFIAHLFIACLDHRKGGTDELNFDWGKAMLTLCRG